MAGRLRLPKRTCARVRSRCEPFNTGHKSQKPVNVYEQIIPMVIKEGDLVFGPMCGSGTTAEAYLRHGRRTVLSDIEPAYVEITRNRVLLPQAAAAAVAINW